MNIIELTDIKKTYVENSGITTQALKGVSLLVKKGEFISIAGPSGSGKTTLLNIIGALDKQDSGQITLAGMDISGISLHKLSSFRLAHIGFIFQSYNLFNSLTALENVEYVLLLQGMEEHKRREKSLALLEKLGMSQLASKRPQQLSGGQQQRIAVARAVCAEPDLILADEPTANLDSHTAANLIDFMRELNKSMGLTFVFSTHDRMVMEKADRLINLKDGTVC